MLAVRGQSEISQAVVGNLVVIDVESTVREDAPMA